MTGMRPAQRALWKCRKCEREFANRNQAHSCTDVTVEDCLKGKHPDVVALYFAFETAVRACGSVRIHPTRARIAFIARMSFAGIKPKRDHVEASLILPYKSDSERFHKFLPYGRGGAHYLNLTAPADIDGEVRGWLSDAYRVGLQERQKPTHDAPAPAPKHSQPLLEVKSPKRSRRGLKVFYFHWNEKELADRSEILRRAGHKVDGHWSTQTNPKFGDYLPDVFVISLDRLPSHGRGNAAWIWETKKRQRIPIIFSGGPPEKVDVFRQQFPRAIFCGSNDVVETIAGIDFPLLSEGGVAARSTNDAKLP
jgi:hypothetical protein